MNRRSFLRGAAAAGAAIPFQALLARAAEPRRRALALGKTGGYGPLVETLDETTGLPLLMLPEGFKYLSFGWTGDPLSSGRPTPGAHDGMAVFPAGLNRVRLVRNHERGIGTPFSTAVYDSAAAGGTTTLEFDTANGALVAAHDSLSGTIKNCAGGPTPWGTWLTCEETNDYTSMPHGYIFEVPSDGTLGSGVPLREMGRFAHEAVTVDPVTGYVYETEDQGTNSGFYRFVPNTPGDLAGGGSLSMLKLVSTWAADLNLGQASGATFDAEWVPIAWPENTSAGAPATHVFTQGRTLGGARFARLEGSWLGIDGRIYIVSTSGGAVSQGQVWAYDPREEQIVLIFESPSAAVLNAPDNITVSPRGGIVLCEDGSGIEYMHGLTVEGEIFKFAQNNVVLNGEKGFTGNFTGNEWAGACYSPDGRWLFANIQNPGITFAITGPWSAGAL
jgi:uncharacterized protein